MRLMKLLAAVAIGCGLAALATSADAAPAKKATSLAECASLTDPFHGKKSADVKDDAIKEYAPLIKTYWAKGCTADFYAQRVEDPALRQRIKAVAPQPRRHAHKKG